MPRVKRPAVAPPPSQFTPRQSAPRQSAPRQSAPPQSAPPQSTPPRFTPSPSRMPDRPGWWKLVLRRQRRILRPTLLALCLMAVAGGCVALLHAATRGAPFAERLETATAQAGAQAGLRVQEIQFVGLAKTPETLVRAALGVVKGGSMLGFSPADARARIEKLHWVQSATVERHLPGIVVVRLVERSPFAVWQNQGKFVLIDRGGDVVADQDVAAFASQLPLLVGAGAPMAAASLVDALNAQPSLLPRLVAAVRIGERRWNLRMTNGADVLLPEGAEAVALAKLVEMQGSHQLLDRAIQTIDMRLPDRLVIRPQEHLQDRNGAEKAGSEKITGEKPGDAKGDPAHPAARRPT